MELKQFASVLWKWKWLLALATVIAVACSYWADRQMPRIYRTTATLMVGQFLQSTDPQPQDFTTSQQLAQSYALMARRQPVLEAASDALGLGIPPGRLAGQVNTAAVPGTGLLQVSAADTDPHRAMVIANEVAQQLILQSPTPSDREEEGHRQYANEQLKRLQANLDDADFQIKELNRRLSTETSARGIQDIQNQIAAQQQKINVWQTNYSNMLGFFRGGRVNYLSVVEPASLPGAPVSPDTRLNLLLAAAIGLILATGAAFLMEYLDETIRSKEDAERVVNLPTLGTITRINKIGEPMGHLVAMQHPLSTISEAYRVLWTNVQFSSVNNPARRLLVTSSGPREGKSTTSSNLAITMARAGKRVILIDADLRRPSIHQYFGLPNRVGLTSLLLQEDLALESALLDTTVAGLQILTSGPLPPNPAELLGSERMKQRLAAIEDVADIILLDSPSVLGVADATILGTLCSGVILVVDAGRTRNDMVRRGKAALDQVGVKILGVVLNRHSVRRVVEYYSHAYAGRGTSHWRRLSGAWNSLFSVNR